MILQFALALAGLTLLYFGAEWLVGGSSRLAWRLGVSPMVVGLTVVAFGTSSPELFVCLDANLTSEDPIKGGGIVMGNIIGSNIFNIALILGVGAVIRPIQVSRRIVLGQAPILVAATLMLLWFLRNQEISPLEGALLFAGLLAFLLLSGMTSAKQMRDRRHAREGQETTLVDTPAPLGMSLTLILIGLLALAAGSHLLVSSAEALALSLGVSEALIGFTVIAFGTSVPELATVIVASLRREGELITGNVIGSNIFNTLAILGIVALVKPIVFDSDQVSSVEIYFMVGLTLFLFPLFLARTRLGRWEGAALLLACLAFAYLLFQRFQEQRSANKAPPVAAATLAERPRLF